MTPVIRHDWSEHFDEFRRVITQPHWTALPMAFSGNRAQDDATVARTQAIEDSSNKKISANAKDGILAFLDGLLALDDDPQGDQTLAAKGLSTASQALLFSLCMVTTWRQQKR